MNIIHIFGITILLVGGAHSLNGDTKTDNSEQKILLRKLQNFQETKPLMWNEVLADVLVNKIGIFSFKNQDKENVMKDDAPISEERTFLTEFFSKVFVVYKKFIYDAFVGRRKENDDRLPVTTVTLDPNSVQKEIPKIDPEEVTGHSEVVYAKGPKSEVELVEPKYHGKVTLDESTSAKPDTDQIDSSSEKNDTSLNVKDSTDSEEQKNDDHVTLVKEESGNDCGEGFVKDENGNCVNNNARLILAIPNQCPLGYRKDWLGYCRRMINF